MSDIDLVDIAIVGGGLVGTPLAIMLARVGWSVALIEQQSSESSVAGTKGYTALSESTVNTLAEQQLWEQAATTACAIDRVHVSHKGYFGSTQIDKQQLGVEALGYVVDNALFLASFQTALQHSTVQLLSSATVRQVEFESDHAAVHYSLNGQQHVLNSRLVIAVDGVSSKIREAAGIATNHTDYDQVGVLGLVTLDQPHNNIAYERFTPSGPLAMLPRPNSTASFVYCINPDMQDTLIAMEDTDFLEELQNAFGYRLGKFSSVGKRVYVPLVRIEARQHVAHRLLLMGNALRLLHPIAGQGYNLAMRDVSAMLAMFNNTDIDPGNSLLLESFATSRSKDHSQVVQMTDLLARTFRGSASIPAHLRALGLLGLDRVPPLRNSFTQFSMGNVH